MAFRSNGPVMLAFPAFKGVAWRIILIALAGYFGDLILHLALPGTEAVLADHLMLHPDQLVHGMVWQLITYPFLGVGLFSTLFSLMSIWFFGTALEDEHGSNWLRNFFLAATIGGALCAVLLSYASHGLVAGLEADSGIRGLSLWPMSIALVIAFAWFHAEQELSFNFLFRLKAKYLAAIYLLIYVALALSGGDRFGALLVLSNAFAGYLFLKFAPRRRLATGVSERWFGLRNAFYRYKRQRAARQFKVYMGKQGKDVSIDSEGRYVDPTAQPRDPNNPHDKRWMN